MDVECTLEDMFLTIANSNASVKSQQRGEPDLTKDEKVVVLRGLFEASPANFLLRFKHHLKAKDIKCLEYLHSDYEVEFHLKEIRSRSSDKRIHVLTRNRRYEFMKELEAKTEYFSLEEMRKRSPLLFEQFVGRYMSESEISQMTKPEDRPNCLSEFLLDCVAHSHQDAKYLIEKKQQEMETSKNSDVEEEDDSDEESIDNSTKILRGILNEDIGIDDKAPLSAEDKQLLQQDFLALMQERFLNGEEEDFDYSTVDNNTQYDALDIREHDEEETYFDTD